MLWRRVKPVLRAALPLQGARAVVDGSERAAEWLMALWPGAACEVCGGRQDVLPVAGYRLCRNCRQGLVFSGVTLPAPDREADDAEEEQDAGD